MAPVQEYQRKPESVPDLLVAHDPDILDVQRPLQGLCMPDGCLPGIKAGDPYAIQGPVVHDRPDLLGINVLPPEAGEHPVGNLLV